MADQQQQQQQQEQHKQKVVQLALKPKAPRRKQPVQKTKKVKTSAEDREALINKILMREIARLKEKNTILKTRKPKREKKDPTPKQRSQWNKFSSRVAKAKEKYYAQAERSSAAWNECMRQADLTEVDFEGGLPTLDEIKDMDMETVEADGPAEEV